MKIVNAQTFVVGTPSPDKGGAFWIFVKLTTDSGVEGIGEVYAVPFHPSTTVVMIEDIVERYVLGSNPFDIERLWRLIYSGGFTQRPDISVSAILSGLEMACWDIVGKELDRPVHELMGGRVRDRIRTCTYIYPEHEGEADAYTDSRVAAKRATAYVAQGFTALKFDPVGPYSAFDPRQLSAEVLEQTEEFVATVRESVGPGVDLLIGTHGQMTTSSAIRLARRLEKFDPLWFEEPTPPENPTEMARVAHATSIPIATGERLSTKYEFARVLECKAASILQIAIGRVGGILETKKIAAAAETQYADIAPHLYAGPVEAAANVQVALCTPNFLIQESIESMGGLHAELLRVALQWEDGFLAPPRGPGLGVELDEQVAAQHPYTDDRLHLEMAAHPVV